MFTPTHTTRLSGKPCVVRHIRKDRYGTVAVVDYEDGGMSCIPIHGITPIKK